MDDWVKNMPSRQNNIYQGPVGGTCCVGRIVRRQWAETQEEREREREWRRERGVVGSDVLMVIQFSLIIIFSNNYSYEHLL